MSASNTATPARPSGPSPAQPSGHRFRLLHGGGRTSAPQAAVKPATEGGKRERASTGGSVLAGDISLAAAEREAGSVARNIGQAAVEVLAGIRPAAQLSRWLSPQCFTALQHRAALTRAHASRNKHQGIRLHRNPQVRSVRACAISHDICEASLVVAEELRTRAVAMRLERINTVWRVTALEIG